MNNRKILSEYILFLMLILAFSWQVSSFTLERTPSGQKHLILKRSHPHEGHHNTHKKPHFGGGILSETTAFEEEDGRHHGLNIRHDGHGSHHVPHHDEREREKTLKAALGEEGLTRVLYDDDQIYTDDDDQEDDDYYYDALLPLTNGFEDIDKKKVVEEIKEEKKPSESFSSFPKKYSPTDEEKKPFARVPEIHLKASIVDPDHDDLKTQVSDHSEEDEKDDEEEVKSDSSSMSKTGKHEKKKKGNPFVLPVTTEGKQKTEDPLIVYGFPKELLPIMPGGGSRFEDVEREKLEKKKMSQMKGDDDDSAENGGGHEAEGLYSSASLSSISLCVYWLASFHHLDRLFLL